MDATNVGHAAAVLSLIGDGNSPFSAATGNLQLSKSPFNPKTMEGWANATFDGYAAKVAGNWENGQDIVRGVPMLTLTPPSGGARWVSGANQTQTEQIFGFRYVDPISGQPVAAEVFPSPLTINGPGQQLALDNMQLAVRVNAFDESSL